jgi:hypothetical protein
MTVGSEGISRIDIQCGHLFEAEANGIEFSASVLKNRVRLPICNGPDRRHASGACQITALHRKKSQENVVKPRSLPTDASDLLTPSLLTPSLTPGQARWIHWPQMWKRKLLFVGVYLLFLLALIWGGGKLVWKWKFGVPLTAQAGVWDFYFPELRSSGVLDATIQADDGVLDVLLLGASTLEKGWGDIEERLRAALKRECGEHVRIFNLAVIAQTSRDSALKFSRIADKHFDVVLIYDGINDCRMNNCEGGQFREDYTHCARYDGFARRERAGSIALPAGSLPFHEQRIGIGSPRPELTKFGFELKTPTAFRQNLSLILEPALRHGSLIVLNTFAIHIPDGYTDEKLKRGELDFGIRVGSQRCPLDMWGQKADVIRCVTAHNLVIEELARTHPNTVLLVDQAEKMSADGKNFVDVCHFTDQGCQQFVDNVMAELGPRLQARLR